MAVYLVDNPAQVATFLHSIENQPTNPPSLYLDIEGVSLSRHGSISILQLFDAPRNQVYLIDVFTLRQAAFDTPTVSGTTLRSILEAEAIPKVFFDVRNDSDALFAHFQVALRGVHDVQLLKAATQPQVQRLSGLARCIERDVQLSVDALKNWQAVKARGTKLFAPEHGGSYEIFNVRPLLPDVISYCAQDVTHLPWLWFTFTGKLSKTWLQRVKAETAERIRSSQSDSYNPNGAHKVWSPWAKGAEGGNSNRKEGNVTRSKGDELHATETQIPKQSVRQAPSVNTNLAYRQAQVVSSVQSSPSAIGATEQQASGQSANATALQLNDSVPVLGHKLVHSHVVLPVRRKSKTKTKPTEDSHNDIRTPVSSAMWTCTTCSREMLASQKEAHLAGKAHTGRVKSGQGVASGGPSLPAKSKINIPKTVETSTAKAPMAKTPTARTPTAKTPTAKTPTAKPPTAKTSTKTPTAKTSPAKEEKVKAQATPKKSQPGGPGSRGSQRRARPATTSTSQQYGPSMVTDWGYGDADWGFIGFDRASPLYGSGRDDYSFGGGYDWGLCDKDCGWCGNCMDNADI